AGPQADPADEVLIAGIGTNRIDKGIGRQECEEGRLLSVRLFEPGEGLLRLAQSEIDIDDWRWRHISARGALLQLIEDPTRVRASPRPRVGMTEHAERHCASVLERRDLLERWNGFLECGRL